MEGISLEELWREVREFVWKVSALLGSRIARPPSPAAILEILPLGFLFRLTSLLSGYSMNAILSHQFKTILLPS